MNHKNTLSNSEQIPLSREQDSSLHFEQDKAEQRIDHSTVEKERNSENFLYCKLKNSSHLNLIMELDGKMECPLCQTSVKNVQKHFVKENKC